MSPRAATQTTLDAVFGVNRKRGAAEVATASGSVPAEKRRKVSESEEVSTVVEPAAEESIPPTGDEVVDFIDNLEKDTMHESWYEALQGEFQKPYFKNLKSFLAKEYKSQTVYPPMKDIYSWSRLTPLDKVRVVVIGQDPYHDAGQAHGLAFSVLPPTKTPPSLRNIYKQVASDISGFKIPNHGDLTQVAEQGVLWLNTCLTVRAHKAHSHSKQGWETFTTAVLKAVTTRSITAEEGETRKGVVFLAWGAPALKICQSIGVSNSKKNLMLKSAHPSPLSARKGFLGNGHFKAANEWLKKEYGDDGLIDWTALNS
ncbi:uracil-DNA glycosylase [Thelephora terrestris]|uniref:Uracil-DNA glycosylase n=1 Tax=Thelephora terrestris TaxID=56493 RepID=A0A9P6HPF3_9AGAM|nr:uracil-DNA glycosylase [Thelephora terrestris]